MLDTHDSQSAASSPGRRGGARGFTLIELLVVIGILVVLIGILIPVIGKVRIAGYTASTKNQILQLSRAIDGYYVDFKSYPGPLPESQLKSPNSAGTQLATSTENMMFGLLGGWGNPPGAGSFVPAEVGRGQVCFNTVPQFQVRYRAYSDTVGLTRQPWAQPFNAIPGVSSTPLAFGDRFPVRGGPPFGDNPSPILYLRARVGAAATGATAGTTTNSGITVSGTTSGSAQYDEGQLKSYGFVFPPVDLFGAPLLDPSSGNSYYPKADAYFQDPNTTSPNLVARHRNGYFLISAGPDGLFGTSDDITNP